MLDTNSWSASFAVATGTVTGREHLRLHRNNQDGLAVRMEPARIIAAVCDGCSAGSSNEVGARLGAAWIAAHLPGILDENPDDPAPQLEQRLAEYLRVVAGGLGPGSAVIREHLLFTLLVAVVEPERTRILALGDGVYAVGEEARTLEPFPDNAPPYLAYRLVDAAELSGVSPLPPVQVLHDAPQAENVIVGSDGLAALLPEELASLAAPCERNPSLLQKRLNVWERRFADDASAIVIRKRERRP